MASPTLNEAQATAFYLSHIADVKEVHMVTGVGVGKTFTIGAWSLPFISIPRSCGLICSPTVPMMKTATLPGIIDAWASHGIHQDTDFVINRRMPGVPPYSGIGSENVITFRWGSYVVLTSLENYNTVNGSQWDWVAVDEERDVRHFEEAMGKIRARLRGVTFKRLGLKHRFLGATTPPDNPEYHIRLREQSETNDQIRIVTATTYMNQANLSPDYIKTLKDTYDPMTFRREVMGELIIAKGAQWAYCFDSAVHTGHTVAIDKRQVWLSFDFNVSPLTCIAAQHSPDKKQIRIIKEWRLLNADISQMAMEIKKWLRETFGDKDTKRLIVTGDSSGKAGTSIQVGESNWNRVIGDLNLMKGQIRVLPANPRHTDSIQLTNSILSKHGDILIDAKLCPYLISDLGFTQRDDNCSPVPTNKMSGHLLDCFRYYLWTFHYDFLPKFAKDNRGLMEPYRSTEMPFHPSELIP